MSQERLFKKKQYCAHPHTLSLPVTMVEMGCTNGLLLRHSRRYHCHRRGTLNPMSLKPQLGPKRNPELHYPFVCMALLT